MIHPTTQCTGRTSVVANTTGTMEEFFAIHSNLTVSCSNDLDKQCKIPWRQHKIMGYKCVFACAFYKCA